MISFGERVNRGGAALLEQVPVVDLNPLTGPSEGRAEVVETVGQACRELGFFQVVNHGVSRALIDRVWEQTRAFFALPRPTKLAISRSKENPRGYYDRELTKNARDLKEVFDFGQLLFPDLPDDHPKNRAAVDGHNQWPAAVPAFKATMLEYYAACEDLGLRLLEVLCRGLGISPRTLHPHFTGRHTSFVRLNYYPLRDPLDPEQIAAVTPLGDMALHHHTDAGALTILLQDDVGGLQVYKDESWLDVEPVPGAFVINVGDMMQLWSNDHYQAAMHRVLPRRERERYSIPFFFNPSYDTDCAPLVSAQTERAKYQTVNWGHFRQLRTDGDYADFGKEIQLADFRIS